jgi:predicted dehydrogenase
VGAGLVGQAAHAHYLAEDGLRFDFVGVADPSRDAGAAVAERYGVRWRPSHGELFAEGLDAVICAAPDRDHSAIVLDALQAGLHVLCEKPLALTLEECDAIVAATDRTGRQVQVGTMKRFDPSYLALLERLPGSSAEVLYVSIEVNDPGPEPFTAHLPIVRPGKVIGPALPVGFEHWMNSLVHDVNLVSGMVQHLGAARPTVDHAAVWDGGGGVSFSLALDGGGRAQIVHLLLPDVNDYTERVTVYCTDRVLELVFPSPYLRHEPTRLAERRSGRGTALIVNETRVSFEEAFRDQLRSFHASIVRGQPVRCDAREARADIALLLEGFQRAGGTPPPAPEELGLAAGAG